MAKLLGVQPLPTPGQGVTSAVTAPAPAPVPRQTPRPFRTPQLGDFHSRASRIIGDQEFADVFTSVAAREGGLTGGVGDLSGGGSYGPLQFYAKGQLPNFAKYVGMAPQAAAQYARNPANWDKVIEFAWKGYLGDTVRRGRAQGLRGAALATYASRNGQRSVNPEESGRQYQTIFAGGGSLTPIPVQAAAPQRSRARTLGVQPLPKNPTFGQDVASLGLGLGQSARNLAQMGIDLGRFTSPIGHIGGFNRGPRFRLPDVPQGQSPQAYKVGRVIGDVAQLAIPGAAGVKAAPAIRAALPTIARESWALPRALRATLDFSAPFRQGLVLAASYPKQFFGAWPEMFRSAFNPKAFEAFNASILTRPNYVNKMYKQAKIAMTSIGDKKLALGEEAFMSNLASRIPVFGRFVRGADRAYSSFLTKARLDTFDDIFMRAQRVGVKPDKKFVQDLGHFINAATGRGDIKMLREATKSMSNFIFSPKLMMSRMNLLYPGYYMKLHPYVRQEALRSMFNLGAVGLTFVTLGALAGAKTDLDPRSADWGKIRIGDTRIDLWGGFQQPMRLAAQLISGTTKSSTTGEVSGLGTVWGEKFFGAPQREYGQADVPTVLQRYFQSKENPAVGFAMALATSQGFMGEPLTAGKLAVELFVPMIVEDLYELAKQDPALLPLIVPAAFGVGVQTYRGRAPKPKRTSFGTRRGTSGGTFGSRD